MRAQLADGLRKRFTEVRLFDEELEQPKRLPPLTVRSRNSRTVLTRLKGKSANRSFGKALPRTAP
jgi:hypothetical protein